MLPGKLTSSNYNFQLGAIKYPFQYNDLGVATVIVVDSFGGGGEAQVELERGGCLASEAGRIGTP